MKITSYRFPKENLILVGTFLLVGIVGILTAGATVCVAPLFVLVLLFYAYQVNQGHHQQLIRQGIAVSQTRTPELAAIVEVCQRRLLPGDLAVYIAPGRGLNAYTFGFFGPQVIVLFDSLLKVMDADELRFIIGHEMGHVALGHTWLNSLLGGMAGVPASLGAAVVLTFSFRSWNRACEFSADRAGLLACGNPHKAITALVKLVARDVDNPVELKRVLDILDKEDDSIINVLSNTLSTHPMLIKRIEEIRRYITGNEYKRLTAQINKR
jgi:Zn-dependent protease with chaperone function